MTRHLPPAAGLALSLLLAPPAHAQPEVAPDEPPAPTGAEKPQRIAYLELSCDLDRCRRLDEHRRLLSLTDLWEGKEYREGDVDAAIRNLMKTGLFETVVPFIEEDRLGKLVTLDAVGATVVRRVHVVGEGILLESEVRRRLFFRPGSRLDDSPENIAEQRAALLQWLSRLGYQGSEVEIEIERDGHEAEVTARLDVGKAHTLRSIEVEGNEAVPEWRIEWAFRQPRRFETIGLLLPPFLPQFIKAARESVLSLYHERGYYEARVRVQPEVDETEGEVDLKVVVREGRQTEVRFSGNDAIADFELEEVLTLSESRSVGEAEIRRTEQAIREEYQIRGYHLATVRGRVTEDPTRPGVRILVFDVHEGPVARIEAIRFEGNHTFRDAALADAITTEPLSTFLGRPGFALDRQLADDVERLRAWYVERGFLSARVALDRIEARQGGEYLTLVFAVTEGPRTFVTAVNVTGVERYPVREALLTMGLGPQTPYGPRRIGKALARLARRYRRDGLPHARVEATCRLPDGRTVLCDAVHVTGPRLVLDVRVSEGPRVTVGEIFVRGNFQTWESTIRDELPLEEGEPFDYEALLKGQSEIRSLGLFRSVGTTLIGFARGEERDRVAIVIAVEERGYEFLDLAAGVQTVSRKKDVLDLGLSLEARYVQENLFGWAKQFELPLKLGNLETSLRPTWSDPRLFGTKTRMSIRPFVAMKNKPLGTATPELRLEPFGLLTGAGPTDSFNVFELGTEVGFRHKLSKGTFGMLDLELERELRRESEDDYRRKLCLLGGGRPPEERESDGPEVPLEDQCNTNRDTLVRLTPGLRWDRRDSPLHPTRGYLVTGELTLGSELTGFQELAESYFVRVFTGVQVYRAFLASRFVLANSLRVGLGFPHDAGAEARGETPQLPADDLFHLGGPSTVRGLPDDEVPVPGDPRRLGGNHLLVYNLELRARLFWWFWAVGFLDVGVLTDRVADLTDDAIWQSLGVGLRWLILDQIPVRLDVGFPVNRRGLPRAPFHFAIGYPF